MRSGKPRFTSNGPTKEFPKGIPELIQPSANGGFDVIPLSHGGRVRTSRSGASRSRGSRRSFGASRSRSQGIQPPSGTPPPLATIQPIGPQPEGGTIPGGFPGPQTQFQPPLASIQPVPEISGPIGSPGNLGPPLSFNPTTGQFIGSNGTVGQTAGFPGAPPFNPAPFIPPQPTPVTPCAPQLPQEPQQPQFDPGALVRNLLSIRPDVYYGLSPDQIDQLFSITRGLGVPERTAQFSIERSFPRGLDPNRILTAGF